MLLLIPYMGTGEHTEYLGLLDGRAFVDALLGTGAALESRYGLQ